MPAVDPAYYDAIDEVVEQRQDDADWDPDEMRSALMEVAQGDSQSAAAEKRSFSQPLLSQRWSDVETVAEEINQKRRGGSSLFRDPVEEAVESFKQFFDELDEKYDLSVSSRVVQMMADEIRDAEQLPLPMYLEKFLRGTNSGVQGTDVDYIRRRYESWVSSHEDDFGGSQMPDGQMGGMGGRNVGGDQRQGMSMGQGVSIGGGGMGQRGMGQRGMGHQNQYGHQQQPPQHYQQPPQQSNGGDEPAEDPRVDELQEQVEALNAAIAEMIEEDDDDGQTVVVETDDGVKAEMPLEQAVQMGYLGDNEPDFMEKLQKAQQAGVIPSPDDDDDDGRDLMETIELLKEMGVVDDGSGDEMAGAIGDAIESLGERQAQVQQQMSQNMKQVMQEMRQMQEDDNEDLTAEDVQSIVEDTLTKSETERIRDEMDEKFSRVMDEVQDTKRRKTAGEQDPEFLKTDRKMEYQEKQLETLNENLRTLPQAVASSVQEGLVPAMKQMQYMDNGDGTPFWSPPGQDQRDQPSYTPEEVADHQEQARAAGRQQERQRRQREQTQQQRQPAQQEEYPDPEPQPEQPEAESGGEMAKDEPSGVSEEKAASVRDKLGLNDDADQQEAGA